MKKCYLNLIPLLFLSCAGGSYIPGHLKNTEIPAPDGKTIENHTHWEMDDSIELYHFSTGEGTPVLMIHGGPAVPFQAPWTGLEGIEGYEFHYYHQRGCGQSTIPFEDFAGWSYPEGARLLEEKLGLTRNLMDIERIRMILGTEKLIIIGHSFGGFLAALYGAEFPDRVERMILVEPADMLRFPPAHGGMNQIVSWLPEEMKAEYKAFTGEYFNYGKFFKRTEEELAGLNNGYARFYLAALENRHPGSTKELLSETPSGTGGFAGHAMFFSLGRKYDYTGELDRIKCPVLVIHGDRDLYSEDTARDYVRLLPEGVYYGFKQSSHFPFKEEPLKFRALVKDFLDGTD